MEIVATVAGDDFIGLCRHLPLLITSAMQLVDRLSYITWNYTTTPLPVLGLPLTGAGVPACGGLMTLMNFLGVVRNSSHKMWVARLRTTCDPARDP